MALSFLVPGQCARQRLCGEIVLRSEMTVESAMGQTGAVHNCVDADAVEAGIAEHPRSDLHDPLAVFGRLLPAHPHWSPLILPVQPLTGYMTSIMSEFR